MPTRNQSGKPSHAFQNPNKKRKKSGKKYEKTIKWYLSLVSREQKEGLTKWIIQTKKKASARIKKYGITQAMLDNAAKKK